VEAVRHPLHGLRTVPAFTLLRAGLAVTRDTARPALRVLAGIGLLPLLAAPVFTHVRRLDRSILDAFVAELRPRAFLGAARSGAGYDLRRWSAVRCPVTAVSGEGDVFATHADLARLAALVPQARTVLLPDCGHFAHVERPHAVADLVLRAGEAGRLHRTAADRRLAS
jgi:pimeloyl-ACP methyl ester carboxylesterase